MNENENKDTVEQTQPELKIAEAEPTKAEPKEPKLAPEAAPQKAAVIVQVFGADGKGQTRFENKGFTPWELKAIMEHILATLIIPACK